VKAWTSKNDNWHVEVSKEDWQVFYKGVLVTEQGRLFASRNVPISVQKVVNELIDQVA